MKRRTDRNEEIGKVYNKLTVLKVWFDGRYWRTECQCECGNKCTPALGDIRKIRRATTSCGCVQLAVSSAVHMKHGHYVTSIRDHGGSPEYLSWQAMKGRCYRSRNASYKHYGGRGITVCERWVDSFENFIADMGIKPTPKHMIDRIDTNGNYCPENCKWSDIIEQCNNKNNNVKYEFNGKSLTVAQISRITGVGYVTIRKRLEHGWTIPKAFVVPSNPLYDGYKRKRLVRLESTAECEAVTLTDG